VGRVAIGPDDVVLLLKVIVGVPDVADNGAEADAADEADVADETTDEIADG